MRTEATFTVRDDAELIARAGQLFTSAEAEFFCAARDLHTWDLSGARASFRRKMRGPEHGLTTRKLLTPAALADEDSRAHLQLAQQHGTDVRISGSALPHETIIIDRRVLILAGIVSTATRSYTVTTSRPFIHGVHSLVEAVWQSASSPEIFLHDARPDLDERDRDVLELLSSGRTDAAAARQMSTSLRSYRRRVAGIMAELSAASRFQAGVHAAAWGLTGAAGTSHAGAQDELS